MADPVDLERFRDPRKEGKKVADKPEEAHDSHLNPIIALERRFHKIELVLQGVPRIEKELVSMRRRIHEMHDKMFDIKIDMKNKMVRRKSKRGR